MIATGLSRKIAITARLAALAPAFALGVPAQWLALRLAPPLARWMPVYFHRYVLFVLGVKVRVRGKITRERPLLIAANHLSWLDILVISSLAPVSFIAKSEVGEWPLFGTLARLQRSVFVERQRRAKTGEVNEAIASRLSTGDALVLFAEGTTSDGRRILPFRSALLGAAQTLAAGEDQGAGSHVQGLNIAYPRLGGLPTPRGAHAFIAWHGDMELMPHLADFFAMPPVDCEVTLLEPQRVDAATNRKALTRQLEQDVRRAHAATLMGRAMESAA
jgi:lyso-ornithine lipid O-acyltransferase